MKTFVCTIREVVQFRVEVIANNREDASTSAVDTHLCGVSDQCGPPEREVVRVEEVEQ